MDSKDKLANVISKAKEEGINIEVQNDKNDDNQYKIIIKTEVYDPKLGRGERNNIPIEYYKYDELESISEDEILVIFRNLKQELDGKR